jgi:hypothetical protein
MERGQAINIFRSSSAIGSRAGLAGETTFYGGYASFGAQALSVADLGSLTRMEVSD